MKQCRAAPVAQPMPCPFCRELIIVIQPSPATLSAPVSAPALDASALLASGGNETTSVERRLLELIDASPKQQLPAAKVPGLFQERFGSVLDFKSLGHTKLKSLIKAMPSMMMRSAGIGQECLCRASTLEAGISALTCKLCFVAFRSKNQLFMHLDAEHGVERPSWVQAPAPALQSSPEVFEQQLLELIDASPKQQLSVAKEEVVEEDCGAEARLHAAIAKLEAKKQQAVEIEEYLEAARLKKSIIELQQELTLHAEKISLADTSWGKQHHQQQMMKNRGADFTEQRGIVPLYQ